MGTPDNNFEMPETSGLPDEYVGLAELGLYERRLAISTALMAEAEKPTAGDRFIGAFCTAALDAVKKDYIGEPIDTALDMRRIMDRDITPRDFVQLLFRAFHSQLVLERGNPYVDDDFLSEDTWGSYIQEVIEDEIKREALEWDLCKDVASNVIGRAKGLKLFLASEQQRLDRSLNVLSVGASAALVEKAIKLNKPLGHLEVLQSPEPGKDFEAADIQANTAATVYVNSLLESPVAIDHMVCVDPAPRDQGWVFTNSHRPEELRRMTPAEQEHWMELYATVVDGVHEYLGDFSEEGMKHFDHKSPVEEFDVVYFGTCLYLFSPHKRQRALQFAKTYLGDTGRIYVQDNARVEQGRMVFPQVSWGRGAYRGIEYDTDSGCSYDIFAFDGGRAKSMMYGRDIGHLAIGPELLRFR